VGVLFFSSKGRYIPQLVLDLTKPHIYFICYFEPSRIRKKKEKVGWKKKKKRDRWDLFIKTFSLPFFIGRRIPKSNKPLGFSLSKWDPSSLILLS
jgi:hypothetical protein